MSAKRFLPFALAALAVTLGPVALSQESTPTPVGTGVNERDWKGLPGAKDPGEPGKSPGWTEVELKITPVEKDFGFRTPQDSVRVSKTNTGAWVDVSNGTLPLTGVKGGPIRFEPRTLGKGKIYSVANRFFPIAHRERCPFENRGGHLLSHLRQLVRWDNTAHQADA